MSGVDGLLLKNHIYRNEISSPAGRLQHQRRPDSTLGLRRAAGQVEVGRRRGGVLHAEHELRRHQRDQLRQLPLAVLSDLAHRRLLGGQGDGAAGDVEDLAVDVPGPVRAEVDHHGGDVLRRRLHDRLRGGGAAGAGHAALGAELTGGVRDGRGHARLGAWGDGVAGDAVAPEVAGDDAGKAGDAGLGGAVVRLAGDAAQARDGGEVHDPAVALLPHEHGGRLDRVEVALEVDGDDGVPFLLAHVEDHAVAEDARDVDQDVDAAEGVDTLADHALAAGKFGDAVVVGDRRPTGGAYLLDYLLGGAGVVTAAVDVDAGVVDDDAGALFREGYGYGAADAATGAGDDGIASFESV